LRKGRCGEEQSQCDRRDLSGNDLELNCFPPKCSHVCQSPFVSLFKRLAALKRRSSRVTLTPYDKSRSKRENRACQRPCSSARHTRSTRSIQGVFTFASSQSSVGCGAMISGALLLAAKIAGESCENSPYL
jgi:hypothetical protein